MNKIYKHGSLHCIKHIIRDLKHMHFICHLWNLCRYNNTKTITLHVHQLSIHHYSWWQFDMKMSEQKPSPRGLSQYLPFVLPNTLRAKSENMFNFFIKLFDVWKQRTLLNILFPFLHQPFYECFSEQRYKLDVGLRTRE